MAGTRRVAIRQKGRGRRSVGRRQKGRGAVKRRRVTRRPRRQRGRGRVKDFMKGVKNKVLLSLRRVLAKKGKKLARKAGRSFLKAGKSILIDGARPSTTIRNTLKKTGRDIGVKLLKHYIK